MTKITVDKALIEQAVEVLTDKCGGRCNAEYNPCHALEVATTLRAALTEPAAGRVVCTNKQAMEVRNSIGLMKNEDERNNYGNHATAIQVLEAYLALDKQAAEPVWNGKLSDAMQKALNALHLECPPEVVSEIAFRVRQECEAIYTSYITVKRMYHVARDALEARDTKAEELKSALAKPAVEPMAKDMTAHQAAYFMERFKKEEKLLGPNEQAAVDFVIDMLTATQAQQQPPAEVPLLDDMNILRMWHETSSRVPMCNHYNHFARAIEQAVRQKAGLK